MGFLVLALDCKIAVVKMLLCIMLGSRRSSPAARQSLEPARLVMNTDRGTTMSSDDAFATMPVNKQVNLITSWKRVIAAT